MSGRMAQCPNKHLKQGVAVILLDMSTKVEMKCRMMKEGITGLEKLCKDPGPL